MIRDTTTGPVDRIVMQCIGEIQFLYRLLKDDFYWLHILHSGFINNLRVMLHAILTPLPYTEIQSLSDGRMSPIPPVLPSAGSSPLVSMISVMPRSQTSFVRFSQTLRSEAAHMPLHSTALLPELH